MPALDSNTNALGAHVLHQSAELSTQSDVREAAPGKGPVAANPQTLRSSSTHTPDRPAQSEVSP